MEYGTIRIKLDELLKESGLSKNMLSHRAEMQRTQINNYCRNQITRLDIDVLARLCTVWGGFASGSESNTIGFHICNLREKLYQASPNTLFSIRSVREVGYCLEIRHE